MLDEERERERENPCLLVESEQSPPPPTGGAPRQGPRYLLALSVLKEGPWNMKTEKRKVPGRS